MTFPIQRLRRLRRTETWRRAVRETALSVDDLIYPLFVVNGEGVRNPVASMPGVEQLSIDELVKEAREVHALGIPGIILFGVPDEDEKDAVGSVGYDPEGLTARAITALKEAVPEILVWADVCLCEYTDHGHCGVLTGDGEVRNDETLGLLARAAVVYADAGADAVAPSDMMDGRVDAIRDALDENGHEHVPVVSYAAKYASAYYGPFRDAAHSTPSFGDRRGYQMDPANGAEALREVELDVLEGADIVMVKPAGAYLDIIYRVKQMFGMPTAAYQVSGEFALIKAAAEKGWVDEERVAMESLVAIKRAGADLILTYFAKDIARVLGGSE
ncbi:MAG: porphobilinogen synthase [Longimicrobiales bacterium]